MKKFMIGAGLLFALVSVFVLVFVDDVDVTLSETMVQEAVNAQIEKGAVTRLGIDLTVHKALVDFKADNTATIDTEFDAQGYGYSASLRGNFGTGLRYSAPRLYLADISANDIETIVDNDTASEFKDYKDTVNRYIQREKEKRLSGKAQNSLGRIVADSEKTAKDYGAKAVTAFFENVPIYDLNNAGVKGSVASLALKDVRFTEDSAVVTLSPRLFVLKVLGGLATLLAIAAYIYARIRFRI